MSLRALARGIACGLLSVALLPAVAYAKSSVLHEYKLDECTPKFCVHAQGANAYVSFLSPVISASQTSLTVGAKAYECTAFAYFLQQSTLTCETKKKTIIVDLATNDITEF